RGRDAFLVSRSHRFHHADTEVHRGHDSRVGHRLERRSRAWHLVFGRAAHDRDDRDGRAEDALHGPRRFDRDRGERRSRQQPVRPHLPKGDAAMKPLDGLKLYGYWRSSASWRVRIALQYKGLRYEYRSVNLVAAGGEQHGGPYRGINPMEQVPTLEFEQ